MMPVRRMKTSRRYLVQTIIVTVILVLISFKGYSQLVINGTTTVIRGNSYTYYPSYNGSPTYSYSGSYYWSITGGYITGTSNQTTKSGTCTSVIASASISITWNTTGTSGSLYLSVNMGTKTITITVVPPLNAGTISPSYQYINWGAMAAFTGTAASGGAASPSYSYQWQKSTDASTWTDISGATGLNYTSDTLQTTRYFRRKVTENTSYTTAYSSSVAAYVYPSLTASIASSQTIPYNTAPSTLTSTVSGGNSSYSYQWQSSPDNVNWTNRVTAATYNPGALTSNQYYRLIVTSNGASVTSNTITISIGLSVSLSITSTTPSGSGSVNDLTCVASGGSTYTYTWYSSINGGSTYQLISGANNAVYTTGEITQTTLYYVAVSSGSYNTNSNTVSITLPNAPTITSSATSVCNGANATFTASGGNGSYKWYNASGTQLGTGTTYSTNISGNYYAVSYSSFGNSAHSNTINLLALNTPSVSSILGSTVCVLGSSAQLANTLNGGTWSSSNASIAKIDANGVVSGKGAGTANITYASTNACGTSSAQLGITVVPFENISSSLGNGVTDPLLTDTISMDANTVKTTEFRQDTAYSSAHSIKNVLALRIAEETDKYIPGDFAATAVLKVEYGHTSTDIYQLDSIKLKVNYTKAEGSKYNTLNYFSFNNAEFTRITVLRVEAPTTVSGQNFDTKQVLQLTNSLAGMRYYKLADNKKPVLSYANPGSSPVPDQLPMSWTLPDHTQNNAVQLEWAWLEDEMKNSYTNNGVFDTALLFNSSATRIDLPGATAAGNYDIPLLYDGTGTLYVRVRAVNVMPSGSRSDGPWSGVSTYAFGGHNNSLNWQMNTTFAEDGKRKTVIQYYDGSLRQRQTVTKDNTTGKTVVAETFYDGQGRPAVQILPAPGINNIIAYTNNLNKFNGQADNTDPADYFDFTTASLGNYGTTPLNESSGTAKYYSTQNPDANTGYHKNIPKANGYAYATTRYMPDATGRILRQSGAGDSLRMGSGHETKYFYGTAAQEELDALFGTEAGNYTHYFKNMVQDANGQMSVSYTDMHGRTVATALAGEAPSAMQALNITDAAQYENQAGKLMTRNLLDKNSNILKGRSIEAINTILVPFKTNHQFVYQLTKQVLTLPKCGGGTVSYDCKFDLQISVTDESGDTDPIVYNYNNIDNINFDETLLLEAGSYSVRKSLTINQASLDNFIAQYNTVGVGICKSQQQLIDSIYAADSTGCAVPAVALTSTNCMTAIGGYTTYLANYASNIGKTTSQLSKADSADIRNQYIADSSFCVSLNINTSSTLATIRKQMLADMVPYSGQYATENGSGTMYNKFNIFSTTTPAAYPQPFYKNPFTPQSTPGNYYGPLGNIDSSVLATRLTTLTKTDFENEFKDTWATSLLPYHPEYKKLKFAEDTLRNTFNFIDSVQMVVAPFSLVTYDPYFTLAGTTANKDSITRYSNVAWKDMNNYSMWQMAYGDAFGCKTIGDPDARATCYANMPKVQTTTGSNINTGTATVTLTTAMQAQAWTMYKGFYGQARSEMVYRYINVRPNVVDTADNQKLIDQNFRIYFPYSNVQAAKNNGWQSWYPKAGSGGSTATVNLTDSVTKYANHCESYINAWKIALMDCPALAAKDELTRNKILNSITGKMLEVCKYGTDGANQYGSSTVPLNITWTPYSNFEDAVNYVLDSAGISRSMLCNPYGIEWPKPYGKNQQVTKQGIASIDNCTCTQWSLLRDKINTAGYNTSSLTSVNQYLRNKYQDTLTLVLYNGLSSCGSDFKYNCRDTTYTYYKFDVPITVTENKCDYLTALPLQSPQPLPVFLTCGFDSSSLKCYSCTEFTNLKNTFYGLFGQQPVFSGQISDSALAVNDLFAKYINFKTGLGYNWMYYADKFNASGCPIGGISGSGAGLSICLDKKPLNDTTGLIRPGLTPCQTAYNRATDKAGLQYEYIQKQLTADFNAAYLNACLAATETFSVADTIKEYHYTLYYYDQAGNLVKTVPPKGVKPDYSNSFKNTVKAERDKLLTGQPWTPTTPQHTLVTRYNYNSLNQVVIQKSPDAGSSRFWYDKLGRLAVSRNAKQKAGNQYSYTYYDALGRITEVGQLISVTVITDAISKSESSLLTWFSNAAATRNQITQTGYDIAFGTTQNYPNGLFWAAGLNQRNLRNRVSYTQVLNNASDTYPASATYYTYDIHGNVDTLLQDFGSKLGTANAMNQSDRDRFKKIVYNYDLISGKVNQVSYQPGAYDAYYHRYEYDAENRLTDVYTGRDIVILDFFPEKEAHYNYYKHGPLAQTILGQLLVQKQDYAYTLQGWLKTINPDNTVTGMIAKNVFGVALNYYNNDYAGIGATSSSAGVPTQLGNDNKPLFNGNISGMGVNIPKLGNSIFYNFQYDQLNRLTAMDAWSSANDTWAGLTKSNDYKERLSYDPNGNILSYLRNGTGGSLNLNNYTYGYTAETNRLASITNSVNSSTGTYTYDDIGNVVKDDKQNVTDAAWNVYGKLQSATKTGGLQINYTYNSSGTRSLKIVGDTTEAYVRDASGNIMSVYKKIGSEALKQTELTIYGSSLIGTVGEQTNSVDSVILPGGFRKGAINIFIRGEKEYLLTDHRSNNMVSITDRRQQYSSDGNTIDYYVADIKTASYYSAFGAISNTYNSGAIKYGFNGQRRSTEISATAQTAEFWEYNGDVGRRLNVDPLMKKYPFQSPYSTFNNNPILFSDPTGLEGDSTGKPCGTCGIKETVLQMSTRIAITQIALTYNVKKGFTLNKEVDDKDVTAPQLSFQWVMGFGKGDRTFDENSVMGEQMLEAIEVKSGIDKAIQTYKEGTGYKQDFARSLGKENEFSYVMSFFNDLDNNPARAFHGSFSGSATITRKEETTFGVDYYINVKISDRMTVNSGFRLPPFLGGYTDGGKSAVYDGPNPYGPNGQFRTININYDMNIKVFRFNSAAKNTIKLFYNIFN